MAVFADVEYKNGPGIRDTIKKLTANKILDSKDVNFACSNGVPAGTAEGLVFCWDYLNNELYIGSEATWTKIIGGAL